MVADDSLQTKQNDLQTDDFVYDPNDYIEPIKKLLETNQPANSLGYD